MELVSPCTKTAAEEHIKNYQEPLQEPAGITFFIDLSVSFIVAIAW